MPPVRTVALNANAGGSANASLRHGDMVGMLSAAVRDIFRERAPLRGKALLFGSRARGDARQDSDWDVLILLDKERITPGDLADVGYPIRRLGWERDAQINPILYTVKDWEARRFTPFYKNVMKEGVSLWA